MAPMSRLELTLLGGFHARVKGGSAIDIATRKTRALLAYLALPPGRHHSRETLVSLLWSDRGEKQAHASLRQALVELSRALESNGCLPLMKDRNTLALNPDAVEVDAVVFEQLASKDGIADLERAATLYAGDLLEGLGVRDSAFEEWWLLERQRLRNRAIAVLKRLLGIQTGYACIATAQEL
jgi:DNA-binding SARP family transcriptional activator